MQSCKLSYRINNFLYIGGSIMFLLDVLSPIVLVVPAAAVIGIAIAVIVIIAAIVKKLRR